MIAVVLLAQKIGMLLVTPCPNSAVTAPQPHVIPFPTSTRRQYEIQFLVFSIT